MMPFAPFRDRCPFPPHSADRGIAISVAIPEALCSNPWNLDGKVALPDATACRDQTDAHNDGERDRDRCFDR